MVSATNGPLAPPALRLRLFRGLLAAQPGHHPHRPINVQPVWYSLVGRKVQNDPNLDQKGNISLTNQKGKRFMTVTPVVFTPLW